MAVYIQGKCRRVVPQVALDSLNIVPCSKGGHGKGVAQIWICQALTNRI